MQSTESSPHNPPTHTLTSMNTVTSTTVQRVGHDNTLNSVSTASTVSGENNDRVNEVIRSVYHLGVRYTDVNQVKELLDYDYEEYASVLVKHGAPSVHYRNVYNLLARGYVIFELSQQLFVDAHLVNINLNTSSWKNHYMVLPGTPYPM